MRRCSCFFWPIDTVSPIRRSRKRFWCSTMNLLHCFMVAPLYSVLSFTVWSPTCCIEPNTQMLFWNKLQPAMPMNLPHLPEAARWLQTGADDAWCEWSQFASDRCSTCTSGPTEWRRRPGRRSAAAPDAAHSCIWHSRWASAFRWPWPHSRAPPGRRRTWRMGWGRSVSYHFVYIDAFLYLNFTRTIGSCDVSKCTYLVFRTTGEHVCTCFVFVLI